MKMITLAALLVSSVAFAKVADTTDFTCAEARANVKRNGFQVYTVNHSKNYTKFVYDAGGCSENIQQAWVPTKDAKHCPIAYVCVDKK